MEKYVPDIYQKSIFTVNYKKLKEHGIKLLLVDLDNTITPENSKNFDSKVKELFDELNKDFKIVLFSNNFKKRVECFSKNLGIDYVNNASKPHPKKYLETFKKYKVKVNEAAMIGDQLLTDIKGGNNVGITTILVDPVSTYDPIWTRFSRRRERKIKQKLRDLGLFKGKYYDEKM